MASTLACLDDFSPLFSLYLNACVIGAGMQVIEYIHFSSAMDDVEYQVANHIRLDYGIFFYQEV